MTEVEQSETPRRGRPPMDRSEPRSEPRAEMRADDPRVRAEARAKELLDHGIDTESVQDRFGVADGLAPDGWTYEWKVHTVLGKEDPSNETAQARMGWEAVPVSRHPHLMPKSWSGNTINLDGMVLMERPQIITDRVKARDRKEARDQVRQKEEQLYDSPDAQLQRAKGGAALVKINKSYERAEIPE